MSDLFTCPDTPAPEPADDSPWLAISAAWDHLERTLRAIRWDLGAGQLTAREAADNYCAALEYHLQTCRRLSQRNLGSAQPARETETAPEISPETPGLSTSGEFQETSPETLPSPLADALRDAFAAEAAEIPTERQRAQALALINARIRQPGRSRG